MQNKDDFGEANTTNQTRNGQGDDREGEVRYRRVKNNTIPNDQAAEDSKNVTSCNTAQHETVLKRFKKKILRKNARSRGGETSKMAAKRENLNSRPESLEEDDIFEGHIYEVPFSNSRRQNGSREATNMANNSYVNGEYEESQDRVLIQRNPTRNHRHSVNKTGAIARQNGNFKTRVGGSTQRPERTANGSMNSRKERLQQSKSLSLPASRTRRQAPLPGLTPSTLPYDMSSEDSSSEDWVQPPPPLRAEQRNLRTLSLPSPANLNLNYQFLNGLNELCKCGWYWGPLSSKEAEVKLHGKLDGSFLVRDSNDNRYLLSLSFRSAQKTLHTRIEFCKGKFSFYAAPFINAGSFASVVELIDNCMETSKDRVYCYTKGRALNGATFPVRLTKPVSRFEYVCTLQHLCRFVIRQHFTLENIGDMPLPGIMKRYLGKNHFDAKPCE